MLFPLLPHVSRSFDVSSGHLPASLLFFHHSKFLAPSFLLKHSTMLCLPLRIISLPSLSLILKRHVSTPVARSKGAAEVSKCPIVFYDQVLCTSPGSQFVRLCLVPEWCRLPWLDEHHVKKKKRQDGSVQWETAGMFLQSSVLSLIVNGRCWVAPSEEETEETMSLYQGTSLSLKEKDAVWRLHEKSDWSQNWNVVSQG